MLLIIAQKYATVFALPNFVVDSSGMHGKGKREREGAAVVKIQCQLVRLTYS